MNRKDGFLKYIIVGILFVIIMFGVVIFVFFGKKLVEEFVYILIEIIVKLFIEIFESSIVFLIVIIELSIEIMSVSSDESW